MRMAGFVTMRWPESEPPSSHIASIFFLARTPNYHTLDSEARKARTERCENAISRRTRLRKEERERQEGEGGEAKGAE